METPTLDDNKKTTEKQDKPSLLSRILSVFKKERKIPTKEEEEEEKKQRYDKLKAELQAYTKRPIIYIFMSILSGFLSGMLLWACLAFVYDFVLDINDIPADNPIKGVVIGFIHSALPTFLIVGPLSGYITWEFIISQKWMMVFEYELECAEYGYALLLFFFSFGLFCFCLSLSFLFRSS